MPPTPHPQRPRPDRAQRTLALDTPEIANVMPVSIHSQVVSLFAQLLLALSQKNPTQLHADEQRKDHPAA
jgi:hypothetical protein